jgi:hypothetical protein
MASSVALRSPTGSRSGRLVPPQTPGGPLLRLATWLRRSRLDDAIARDRDRHSDPAVNLRRAQLADPAARRRLSRRLEDVLTAPPVRPAASSALPVDRDAVEVAKPVLRELILRLRSPDPVDARGVALGSRLLTDPLSPIYLQDGGGSPDAERLRYESLATLRALQPPARVPGGATDESSRA